MNYSVPDLDMDDEDNAIPTTSTLTRPNKLTIGDQGELMELLWENGQPVLQSQTQRSFTKRPLIQDDAVAPPDRRATRSSPHIEPGLNNNDHLFMQEDEMAFWLHHYPPLDCTDLYSDVIDPASPRTAPPLSTTAAAAASQPRRSDAEKPNAVHHFGHISSRAKAKAVVEQGPSRTEVESREKPCVAAAESVASRVAGSTVEVSGGVAGLCAAAGGRGGENGTCELMSSSGGSGRLEPVTEGDRKRKGPEADDYSEGPDEDVECESPDARKQVRGSTPAKKSRIAEVHNLSEKRRRDRINKRMRALQELIPGCNKSDKASMLDEAIEYLKSLQLQVQMMSMGCSMVPMMFPGFQQYMPPMGMATGMEMGMEMGMSQPTLPFPSVLAGSALPSPGAAAYMRPSFPVPVFHMLSVPLPSPSNQSDPVLKSLGPQNHGQPQMMNFPGPYQQYPGLRHTTATAPESNNHAAKYQ